MATYERAICGRDRSSRQFRHELAAEYRIPGRGAALSGRSGLSAKGLARPSPILAEQDHGFGVRLKTDPTVNHRRRSVSLGLDGCETTNRLQKGDRAVLAQEIPIRTGRFTFTVEACLTAYSKERAELFAKHFSCRLVIYRFADGEKNRSGGTR